MKNLIFSAFLFCGTGAIVLLAADSWQKKPYTEWSDKEVRKILNDSPWARTMDIMIGAPRSSQGLPPSSSPLARAGGGPGGSEGGMGGGGGMGGRGGRNAGMEGSGSRVPTMNLVVRFMSALPVRQAMMRARYGDEVGKSPDAAKVLSMPDKYYVVAIAGLRRPPNEVQALKEKSTLRAKGKEPFGPVEVQIERGTIMLFFAREGNPVVVEDGEVEVKVQLPGLASPIRRSFKLKDMVYDGKLEL